MGARLRRGVEGPELGRVPAIGDGVVSGRPGGGDDLVQCQDAGWLGVHGGHSDAPPSSPASLIRLGCTSGPLRIVHRPQGKITAATTVVSATRIPDSPIHSVAPAPVLAGSNAIWIMAFQAACSAIAGQTLPVSSRRRANAKLNAVAITTKSTAERAGVGPTR